MFTIIVLSQRFWKPTFQRQNGKVNEGWKDGTQVSEFFCLKKKKKLLCPFYKRAQAAVFGLPMNIRQIKIRTMHNSIAKISNHYNIFIRKIKKVG
jgi:hypothetical protein